MSEAPLTLDRVTRRYGQVLGLNDVTVRLGRGITGLVGPNGAGKTTFLRLAVGMLRATSGEVRVFGRDLWRELPQRGAVGYCPDGERLFEWMTGREMVVTLGRCSGLSAARAAESAAGLFGRLEMDAFVDKPIREYSKGMRQKIKLVQAVLHEPRLLVLDEPLNGVDPVSRAQILDELRRLATAGAAVLISSHVLHELETVVDEVVLIHRGRLLASGTVESIRDLLDEHPHTVRLVSPRPLDLGKRVLDLPGVVGWELAGETEILLRTRRPASLYAALPAIVLDSRVPILEVSSPDSSLEAVFRYLVKGESP